MNENPQKIKTKNLIILVEDNKTILSEKLAQFKGILHYPIKTAKNFTQLKELISLHGERVFIVLLDYHLEGANNTPPPILRSAGT